MKDGTGQPHTLPSCPSRDLLETHAFAAESLSPLQREQVVDHLAVCPVCAEAYLSLCQLEERLIADTPGADAVGMPAESATSDEQILEGLWKYVATEEIVTGSRRTYWLPQRRALVAMAASLLLALGLAAWWHASRGSQGRSPVAVLAAGPGGASRAALSREAVYAELPIVLAEPAPFDPDRVDYEKWRDEHQEWFAATFPWIFEAQKVLRKKGIQADYIELLMVSGDIWQFHYDPEGGVDQRLAVCRPVAMGRLARHYGIPVVALQLTTTPPSGGADSEASSTAALRRWNAALVLSSTSDAPQVDLLLFSLRATRYLADTRVTVYLWCRQDAARLHAMVEGGDLPDGPRSLPAPAVAQAVLQQGVDARKMHMAVQRLMTRAPGCQGVREFGPQVPVSGLSGLGSGSTEFPERWK